MKASPLTKAQADAVGIVLQRLDHDILLQAEYLGEEQRKAEVQARIITQASAKLDSLKFARHHLSEQMVHTNGSPKRQQSSSQGGIPDAANPRSASRLRLDHDKIALEVFQELAPEFTSHDFQARCIAKHPGRESEFTRIKIKKRLRKHAGFDDAPIALIAKGGGRRPPRFRVNPRN